MHCQLHRGGIDRWPAVDELDGALDAREELRLAAAARETALLQHGLEIRDQHALQLRAPQGEGKRGVIRTLGPRGPRAHPRARSSSVLFFVATRPVLLTIADARIDCALQRSWLCAAYRGIFV